MTTRRFRAQPALGLSDGRKQNGVQATTWEVGGARPHFLRILMSSVSGDPRRVPCSRWLPSSLAGSFLDRPGQQAQGTVMSQWSPSRARPHDSPQGGASVPARGSPTAGEPFRGVWGRDVLGLQSRGRLLFREEQGRDASRKDVS